MPKNTDSETTYLDSQCWTKLFRQGEKWELRRASLLPLVYFCQEWLQNCLHCLARVRFNGVHELFVALALILLKYALQKGIVKDFKTMDRGQDQGKRGRLRMKGKKGKPQAWVHCKVLSLSLHMLGLVCHSSPETADLSHESWACHRW